MYPHQNTGLPPGRMYYTYLPPQQRNHNIFENPHRMNISSGSSYYNESSVNNAASVIVQEYSNNPSFGSIINPLQTSQNHHRMNISSGCSYYNESSVTAAASVIVQESSKRQKTWSCSMEQESLKIQTKEPSSQKRRVRSSEGGYRKWSHTKSHSPSGFPDKFVLVSYNILGDANASNHGDLYCHISPDIMDWSSRKRLICQELDMWKPDLMCFQEVDHFDELDQEFGKIGYSGIFKGRTGEAKDGCAIFWKNHRFRLLQEESIEFKEFDLRHNVAQLCVFELNQNPMNVQRDNRTEPVEVDSLQEDMHPKGRRVVIGNIHVLFNPKRGDIKLGQVRVLLQEAHALSEKWGKADVVIAGDFNSTPQSTLYKFLVSSELDLLEHDRRHISGQIESVQGSDMGIPKMTRYKRNRYRWDDDELKNATGSLKCTRLQHPLKLFSAYACVQGSSTIRDVSGEPLATSYHSKFLGTVDYIWHSEGLIPLRVLDTLPLDVLRQTTGLPSEKWGSDHLSLACEFAFAADQMGDDSKR